MPGGRVLFFETQQSVRRYVKKLQQHSIRLLTDGQKRSESSNRDKRKN